MNSRSKLKQPKRLPLWLWTGLTLIAGGFAAVALLARYDPCALPEGIRIQFHPLIRPAAPLLLSIDDESSLRKTVAISQEVMLKMFQNPDQFQVQQLDLYWLKPTTQSQLILKETDRYSGLFCQNTDWEFIRDSVRKLRSEELHNGNEQDARNQKNANLRSKKLSFQIRSVELLIPHIAVVTTREQWYMPLLNSRGRRMDRNPYIGPIDVQYYLTQHKGQWAILKSTTPRFRSAWSKRLTVSLGCILLAIVALFYFIYKRLPKSSNVRLKRRG